MHHGGMQILVASSPGHDDDAVFVVNRKAGAGGKAGQFAVFQFLIAIALTAKRNGTLVAVSAYKDEEGILYCGCKPTCRT